MIRSALFTLVLLSVLSGVSRAGHPVPTDADKQACVDAEKEMEK